MDSKIEPVAVTAEMVNAAEAAIYPRHERGFLLKPLIDPIDMRAILEAVLPAALLAAEQRGRESERELLGYLAADTGLELSWGEVDSDDEGGPCAWRIHRRSGNINDRVWDLLSVGETPAEAIAAAIRKGE